MRYNPKTIEKKWQKIWQDNNLYQAVDFDKKPKFVMLVEFPYPSGSGIHIGHTREYTIGDIIARYKRMKGFNVLFPIGYDAFGLPTENFAIKNKISPIKATEDNVKTFNQQIKSLGLSFDWSRLINTSDPNYYKWTQWLFLKFFNAGMVYQDQTTINWCPFCKTGLANEEVVNGRHERCDNLVEKKTLKQWIMRITKYADRLIDGLKDVNYPSKIADQQINWIGKSIGAEIVFKIEKSNLQVEVFSTRIDTIYSAACLILAPEHPLVGVITTKEHKQAVENYLKESVKKTEIERQNVEKDKSGVFTGTYAVNPINGSLIPVWVANFVLVNYGTGAVFGDIHDERDYIFLKQHNIPAIVSVIPKNKTKADKVISQEEVFTQDGVLINSEQFNGLSSKEAREVILDYLSEKQLAVEKINYRLRDWIFSRQHYWGEPIPIIHCPDHGPVSVPEDQLPVVLPNLDEYQPTDNGKSPLSKVDDWVNTTCPICQKPAKRETDTMPNWAGSSWYYLRYFDVNNDNQFADQSKLNYWQSVDLYLGGMEHTTLHLLYSRFWHQFLYDQKIVPTPEPYAARLGQGIILGPDGVKMSKSKGNVVNPTEIIESGYGADALRVAIAFIAPYDQTTPWNPEILGGTYRFLNRLWVIVGKIANSQQNDSDADREKEVLIIINRLIEKITVDIEQLNFNTAIASLMESLNSFYKLYEPNIKISSRLWNKVIVDFIKLLSPFAPHIAEELLTILEPSNQSVHFLDWPIADKQYLTFDESKVVVQINGKMKTILVVNVGTSEDHIKNLAIQHDKLKQLLKDKQFKKIIYLQDKLINFVI